MPHYTRAFKMGFLCAGAGSIEINSDDDTWNSVLSVGFAGSGIAGTHSLADAVPGYTDDPVVVSADSTNRAIDVTFAAAPANTTLTWEITDTGGGKTLRVYSVMLVPMWPLAGQSLV